MGGFYVADKQTCEEFDMTMSKKQFYDLAGVPIRRIFEMLAEQQGRPFRTWTPWRRGAR